MPTDEMTISMSSSATKQVQPEVAQAELRRMRKALEGWLKFRAMNDAAASGAAAPAPFFKRPGAAPAPQQLSAQRLVQERAQYEGRLAANLHILLSEMFDSSTLPSPDLNKNPMAAVELAQIAIDGRLPGDAKAPSEMGLGFIWLWPMVMVVGLVAFVITSKIRNDAEEAQERERLQCIREGRCTDYGFWLKMGGIAVTGWFLWDKLGLRDIVSRSRLKRRGR